MKNLIITLVLFTSSFSAFGRSSIIRYTSSFVDSSRNWNVKFLETYKYYVKVDSASIMQEFNNYKHNSITEVSQFLSGKSI